MSTPSMNEHYGDDQIQEILADAFMEARRG
jgi:hypothetical protein